MHKARVKAQRQHLGALRQKGLAPALEGLGVVQAKGVLFFHLQAHGGGLRPKGAGAGQAAARKNVLLNKVGRIDIARKQRVVDHDALDAGAPTGLEQLGQACEIGGPVVFAHGFDHLYRANGVKGRVVNVAVVLQAQVGAAGHAQALHAFFCKSELLGAQGHAGQVRAKGRGGHFGQGAPAAANFQHAVARAHAHLFEHAAHLGGLRLLQALLQIAGKQGRRIVHARVQPARVKRVAQVVMGVDVFLAVGARVAVEPVLEAVGQLAPPAAKNHLLHLGAVLHQHAQQRGQVGRGPVTGNKAFGKANIAGLERG